MPDRQDDPVLFSRKDAQRIEDMLVEHERRRWWDILYLAVVGIVLMIWSLNGLLKQF